MLKSVRPHPGITVPARKPAELRDGGNISAPLADRSWAAGLAIRGLCLLSLFLAASGLLALGGSSLLAATAFLTLAATGLLAFLGLAATTFLALAASGGLTGLGLSLKGLNCSGLLGSGLLGSLVTTSSHAHQASYHCDTHQNLLHDFQLLLKSCSNNIVFARKVTAFRRKKQARVELFFFL